MRVGVTGASGFVGGDIARALLEAGHDVVALGRNGVDGGGAKLASRQYDLAELPYAGLLTDLQAVVHCAFVRYDQRHSDAFDVNVRGTLALFDLAAIHGVRFIFISSLSALPEARSHYGRHKHYLEEVLFERGASIVRPGLVIGDGGTVRTCYETMRRLHLIPLVDGGNQFVQYVGRRDLSTVIRVLTEKMPTMLPSPLTVAVEAPITVRQLCLDLRRRFGLAALPVSLPFGLVYPAAVLAEAMGCTLPLATENLLGLQSARVQVVTDVEGTFRVSLASWSELVETLEFA